MLIASKYEEIWAPEVRDFVYISDKAYTREQILNMEKLMLNTLRFKLTVPTPFNFLARHLKVWRADSAGSGCSCLSSMLGQPDKQCVSLVISSSTSTALELQESSDIPAKCAAL